uniref:G-protein coupled receptor No9 n=1 Tax=Ascaris suum TaxID=6253 RepID=F1L901_ASCSU
MASNPSRVTFDRVASVSVTAQEDHTQYGFMNEYRNVLRAQLTSQTSAFKLCLGLHDVFIALFLVLLILMTIFGNILVVLSVFVYQRMRTFTNILLTSLATADLLVGLVVMPLSLLDLLHSHRWPLGRLLCGVWATTDVLLCTASILNLCVISLDRYMAITRPLRYPRTRSKKMAAGLLSCVWLLSLVICSPPWFVPGWGLFTQYSNNGILSSNITSVYSSTVARHPFACVYSPSVPYRIYSALVEMSTSHLRSMILGST